VTIHSPGPKRPHAETALLLVLRFVGTVSLLATVAVFMPYDWMDRIHRLLGLGTLPAEPVVGYLARTLSAFYALVGGLLWVLSFDLHRHRVTLLYLGLAFIGFGAVAMWVDFTEGMPWLWRISESPIVIVYGAVILALTLRVRPATRRQGDSFGKSF